MPIQVTAKAFTPSLTVFNTTDTYTNPIVEGSTGVITFTLLDASDDPILEADIDAFTITVRDEETSAIVNELDSTDALAGPVDIDGSGVVTWALTADDTVIVDPSQTKRLEYHEVVFRITVGSEVVVYAVRFPIKAV